MTVLYTNTFTGADGSAPANLSLSEAAGTGGTRNIQANTFSTVTTAQNFNIQRWVLGPAFWSQADGEALIDLIMMPSGLGQAQLILRGTGIWDVDTDSATAGYKVLVNFAGNTLDCYKRLSGSDTLIGGGSFVYVPGSTYRLRFRITGTSNPVNCKIKIWSTAGAEPSPWNMDLNDIFSPITDAGLCMGNFRTVSTAVRELRWDNLTLDDLTGSSSVTGTLAVTLAEDTLVAAGTTSNAGLALINTFVAVPSMPMLAPRVSMARPVWRRNAFTPIAGTIAVTLADDSLTAAGTMGVFGTLAVTLQDDTLVAAGSMPGTLNVTLQDDTLVAAGSSVTGSLHVTLADDTLVAGATQSISGTLAQTLADDSLVAGGDVWVVGDLAQTLADDSLSASGTVTNVVIGALAVTLEPDTLIGVGQAVTSVYTFEPPHDEEGPRKLSEYGRRRGGVTRPANDLAGYYHGPRSFSVLKLDGEYVAIQGPTMEQINASTEYYAGGHIYDVTLDVGNALSNSGFPVHGITQVFGLHRTLAPDVLVAAGFVGPVSSLHVTLDDDTLVAVGTHIPGVTGALSVTLDDDVLVAAGEWSAIISGTLNRTLDDDVLVAVGEQAITGDLVVTLDDDTLVAAGTAGTSVTGTLNVTLDDDVASSVFTLVDENGDPILDENSDPILVHA